ncbi:MAG: di-trans,poly-cis-decaprenylcistransferase [Candidatus Altiarchaeales archaeon WOR_SM1_86-2]|nr:MAG: di-trans,poly-cis-decaprenylcistransferase [Candidatus Altiarchaeales archaeon WOR_SM1_86-2]
MHVGLIPDGNRRYMKNEDIDLKSAYLQGINKFYDFLEWCVDLGVDDVTIYALSIENIERRSEEELYVLFDIFSKSAEDALNDERIHKNRIRINVCGNKEIISVKENGSNLLDSMNKLEASTRNYSEHKLNLAIGYGGRQEIINAAASALDNGLELNPENISKFLWVKDEPDIIIRTGEHRISNFLLWQGAYSEIYFADKLWPDFQREDLMKAIKMYSSIDRKFGK